MQVNKSKKYAYILVFLSIHGRYAVFFFTLFNIFTQLFIYVCFKSLHLHHFFSMRKRISRKIVSVENG